MVVSGRPHSDKNLMKSKIFVTIVTAPVLLNDWLNNVLEVVIPLRWKQYLSIIQWSQDFGWMLGWKCEDVEPGPGEFGDRSGWHYGHSR